MFEQEIWKDIEGYEGLYQISNYGRVKRLKRSIIRKNKYNDIYNFKEIIKKPFENGTGYFKIFLIKNNKQKSFYIHRLVAKAFILNPNNYPCINHKDENKKNNKVNNLEWCSYYYNNTYNNKAKKGGKKRYKKVNQYDLENNLLKTYNSLSEASKENRIDITSISKCCLEKKNYKTAGGFKWKYFDNN